MHKQILAICKKALHWEARPNTTRPIKHPIRQSIYPILRDKKTVFPLNEAFLVIFTIPFLACLNLCRVYGFMGRSCSFAKRQPQHKLGQQAAHLSCCKDGRLRNNNICEKAEVVCHTWDNWHVFWTLTLSEYKGRVSPPREARPIPSGGDFAIGLTRR